VADFDRSYPYSGGTIGVFGYNVRTNTLWQSSAPDVMGYCDPNWISDYTFNAIMNYRGFSASALMASGLVGEQPALLVWGRVSASGDLVLEPAMRLTTAPSLPTASGSYEVTGYDDAGTALFTLDFEPTRTSKDGTGGGAHFAFAVPVADATYQRLARLEFSGNGRRVELVSRQQAAAAEAAARGLEIAAEASARARLRWNAAAFPMVMLRDPDSGEVLSFARNGDLSVVTSRPEVDVVLSDGVRSASARVRVRGR
jgi:hypothetical protein